MDLDKFQRTLATAHPLESTGDENVSKKAKVARNVLHIRGESGLKFDVNEEAWPNADLAIRSSCEGALIDSLPADKVKAGDQREIRQMKNSQLHSWIKGTDVPHDKTILLTGWARQMKGGEVRSRCVLKDFATTVRNDIFSPTPSPLSVRRLLLYAAWYDLRIETGDLLCAFMQAASSSETFATPPKRQEREGWIWKLHGAMNGMKPASRDVAEFLAGLLTKHMGFKRGKLERCLFVHESNETRVVSHVDDPLICAKPATLDKFWAQITLVVIKRGEALNPHIPVTYLGVEYQSVHEAGRKSFTVKPTNKYLDECLDIVQLRNAKAVMTLLTELRSTNLHNETTVCYQAQHTVFRTIVEKLQYITGVRQDLMFATKCLSHKLGSLTLADLARAKKALRYLKGTRDMKLYLTIPAVKPNDPSKTLNHVTGYYDADWAGDPTTRKSTSCTLCYVDQFLLTSECRGRGTVALSSGESELYALGALSAELIFAQAILKEIGLSFLIHAGADSSTKRAVAT